MLTTFCKGRTKLRNDAPGRAMIIDERLYSQIVDPRRCYDMLHCMDTSIYFYVMIIQISEDRLCRVNQWSGDVHLRLGRAASGYSFLTTPMDNSMYLRVSKVLARVEEPASRSMKKGRRSRYSKD